MYIGYLSKVRSFLIHMKLALCRRIGILIVFKRSPAEVLIRAVWHLNKTELLPISYFIYRYFYS